mmetsp:Transcript_21446/g.18270  ORF Transcript_21446/g.18270 Transcript_21446/m.18270 type:complete len:89 (-) Transcript_21446:13-279(-)
MILEQGILDIEPAVEFLSTVPMSIPAYLSMGGSGDKFQAAVVTRDEDGLAIDQNGITHQPLYLNNTIWQTTKGGDMIVLVKLRLLPAV